VCPRSVASMIYIFFYLTVYSDRQALHSFPTRRSSDLRTPQAKGRVERLFQTLQDRLVKAMRRQGIDSIEQANAWLPGYLAQHNEDRKSTRLNSSHVKISYAVFCLKKKIQMDMRLIYRQ